MDRRVIGPSHEEHREVHKPFPAGIRPPQLSTNKATAVTWTVDNVKEEVAALKSKGVVFEHYDMPGMTRDGDVYVAGDMKVAWFKDPDGNILNVAGR